MIIQLETDDDIKDAIIMLQALRTNINKRNKQRNMNEHTKRKALYKFLEMVASDPKVDVTNEETVRELVKEFEKNDALPLTLSYTKYGSYIKIGD